MVRLAIIVCSNRVDGLALQTSLEFERPVVTAREANRLMPSQPCFQRSVPQPKSAARISFNSYFLAPDSRPKIGPVGRDRERLSQYQRPALRLVLQRGGGSNGVNHTEEIRPVIG